MNVKLRLFTLKDQLCGQYHHPLVSILSSINVIKEVLDVLDHVRRRNNLCPLSEVTEPTIELLTDCDFNIGSKVTPAIGIEGCRIGQPLCPEGCW